MKAEEERRRANRANRKKHDRIRERADEMYASDDIHVEHELSLVDAGCWVSAWVWVPKEDK